MASRAQLATVFNRPAVVQGRLEEILIKNYLKGAEILILLPSQTGHCKIPDCVEILNIARPVMTLSAASTVSPAAKALATSSM